MKIGTAFFIGGVAALIGGSFSEQILGAELKNVGPVGGLVSVMLLWAFFLSTAEERDPYAMFPAPIGTKK